MEFEAGSRILDLLGKFVGGLAPMLGTPGAVAAPLVKELLGLIAKRLRAGTTLEELIAQLKPSEALHSPWHHEGPHGKGEPK
jgi:hypothetical protein